MRTTLFVLVMILASMSSAYSQVSGVYKQRMLRSTSQNDLAVNTVSVADTSTGNLVGFIVNYGFFFIDPARGVSWTDTAVPGASIQSEAKISPYLNGFIALTRSNQNAHYRYDVDKGFQQLQVPDSLNQEVGVGMFMYPGNYIHNPGPSVLSPDLGVSWYRVGDSLEIVRHDFNGFNTPLFRSKITRQSYIGFVENGEFELTLIPFKGNNVINFVGRLETDSLLWFTRDFPPKLRMGQIGDTTFSEIAMFDLSDTVVPFKPNRLMNLASGAVLYIDESGRAARIQNGRVKVYAETFPVGLTWLPEYRGARKCIVKLNDGYYGLCTYQLTDPPSYDIWRIHPSLLPGFVDAGRIGVVTGGVEGYEQLFHFQSRRIFVLGSLLRDFEFLNLRRMLFCIETNAKITHVLTDIDQLVEVSDFVGYAQLIRIRGKNELYRVELRSDPDWLYPTEGISMVLVNDSTLMFPGGVLRTISVTGQTIDTLYNGYVSSVSRLDDGTFVSADRGLLRFHRSGVVDSVVLAPADSQGAGFVGYPSKVVSAFDGSLLCGVLGMTRRAPTEPDAEPYAWGGIMRSSDNGKSWKQIPLPDTSATYVVNISKTHSNALIALCVRVEQNPEANPMTYSCDNITIIRSTDNGLSWTSAGNIFYNGPYIPGAGSVYQWNTNGILSIATMGGLFHSNNDGVSWYPDLNYTYPNIPISLSAGNGGTMLISSTTGVQRMDKPTSVLTEQTSTADSESAPVALTRQALINWMRSNPEHTQINLSSVNGTNLQLTPETAQQASRIPVGVYAVTAAQGKRIVMIQE